MTESKIKGHEPTPLKLHAADAEDLQIISSILQDSLIIPQDITYFATEKRFAILLNRFCWEKRPAIDNEEKRGYRIHTGCIFNNINQVQQKGLDDARSQQILNLLVIEWHATEKAIILSFSGNISVRLITDKINCYVKDFGDPWPTCWQPQHNKNK